MGDPLLFIHGNSKGGSNATNGFLVEGEITYATGQVATIQDLLSIKIGDGSLVLVYGADKNTLATSSGSQSKFFPPTIKGSVTDFAPIDADEDHGLFSPDQDDTLCEQGVGNALGLPKSAHHTVANWYSDVSGESGYLEFRGYEDRGIGENSDGEKWREKLHCEKG